MRKEEQKMFINYIKRFLNPRVPVSQKIHAFGRYLIMGGQFIGERIRGLDYTMIYSTDEDNQKYNGSYTKTPISVLNKVFNDIELCWRGGEKNFIDIGCGKGYVVTIASRKSFDCVGGVEYNQHLYDVCCNNLKKSKISTEYIYRGDAGKFEHYGDYNIFFFNNPVGAAILVETLQRISSAHKHDKIYIYYINVNEEEKRKAFQENGFHLIKIMRDGRESYFDIWVYCNIIEKDEVNE